MQTYSQAEWLAQLQHHQAAESAHQTAVGAPTVTETATAEGVQQDPGKPPTKRKQHALQSAFLGANLNRPVVIYLMNNAQWVGRLKEYDQFCILLAGTDGINSMLFKYAVASIMPVGR